MRVSVNGSYCEVPPGVASFGDLVFFVEQQRLPAGEVLTRIVLNGEELDEQREKDCASQSCSSIQSAEFHSARPAELALEGLQDAAELLPSLMQDLPVVAQELRSGKLQQGLEMLDPCLEVISWYVSLISALDTLFSRGDPLLRPVSSNSESELSPDSDAGGLEWMGEMRTFASIENLRQKLIDLEQAQQQQDHLLLADLLEYELLPIVQLWSDEVPQLLRRLDREEAEA